MHALNKNGPSSLGVENASLPIYVMGSTIAPSVHALTMNRYSPVIVMMMMRDNVNKKLST
jgi:hypothetical protein